MAIVERRAVCFLACRPDGKILGIYRNNNPIGWGLVGGKVDPGETDEIAVAREANEEAGITVTAIQKVFERTSQVRRTWMARKRFGLFPLSKVCSLEN
jgi:8-oxo-dGTP pyrophosphatase MutT (NUDIX family)